MRAITVIPGQAGSAKLEEVPEPEGDGVLVQGLELGVCGTDREIVAGDYGWAPEGRERLILGHESLGRVLEAPDGSELSEGDLVVGIVRRPDPVPCPCCARGEWDMCRNGRYTEHGIKEVDGFGSERWRIEPERAVRVDPSLERVGVLMEPASIVAKGWDQIDYISRRGCVPAERVLVTGAGPIGQLAALLAVQRGYRVEVLDRVESGPRVDSVKALGATFTTGPVSELEPPDIIVECTGTGALVLDVLELSAEAGIICLTGVSSGGRTLEIDPGDLNRRLVLGNDLVFGTVNANRRHYELAAEALARADAKWLEGLIAKRVPLDDWQRALEHDEDVIKAVIELS